MKKRLISAIMASAIAATTLSPVFAEGNTISMSYSNGQLIINSSQLSKGTLIYSEYENGRLTNVKLYKDISFEKNTFTIEAEEGDKFILVDSIDKMQPLCDSITVSKDIPIPTEEPTSVPTEEPTATVIPTDSPTATPTATPVPTYTPSPSPTTAPTETPSPSPTVTPTSTPNPTPTVEPTKEPTVTPTLEPTSTPTEVPTETPTEEPTATPSPTPTAAPTEEPTTTLERYITFAGDEATYYNIKVAIDVTTVSNTPKKVTAIDDMPEGYRVTGVLLSDNKLMVSVMKDDVLVAIVEATEEPAATPEPTFTPSPEPTEKPTDIPTEAPTEEPVETPEPETIEVGIAYYDVGEEWAELKYLYMPVVDGQVTFTSEFVEELIKEYLGYEFYLEYEFKCIFSLFDEDNKITTLPASFEKNDYGLQIGIEYQKKATPTPEPTPIPEPTATPKPKPIEVAVSYYDIDGEWDELKFFYMPVIDEQVTFTSDFIEELAKEHVGYEFKCIYSQSDEDNKITELPASFEKKNYIITICIEYQKKATPTPEPTATPSPTPEIYEAKIYTEEYYPISVTGEQETRDSYFNTTITKGYYTVENEDDGQGRYLSSIEAKENGETKVFTEFPIVLNYEENPKIIKYYSFTPIPDKVENVSFGEDLYWSYTKDNNTLTINGNGKMRDISFQDQIGRKDIYVDSNNVFYDWYEYYNIFTNERRYLNVSIENGITSLSSKTLHSLNLLNVYIPNSVVEVDAHSLSGYVYAQAPQWLESAFDDKHDWITSAYIYDYDRNMIRPSSYPNITYVPDPDGKEYYAVWNEDEQVWVKTLKEDTTEETPTTEPTETPAADAE